VTRKPRRALPAAALALAACLALVACGASSGGESGGSAPDYAKALAGSPPPLATLHGQGNELLGGGTDAFEKRLGGLRGFPVVVNKWASWCGPCRAEFPFLQQASARFGRKVAFLGVNSQDSDDAAATFLSEYPVPYPSYTDPDQQIAEVLKATLGFPSTAFYDRNGKQVYLRQGGYPSRADLFADIRRYGLGDAGASG
jgi:cytochrome c biogenesis protein CcmG, thiol:disulfide interchange protein DsbE